MKFKNTGASSTTVTRNLNEFIDKTGNIFQAVSILAKRSTQISEKMKEELLAKLEEFALDHDQLDEVFENVIKEFIKSYNGNAVINERLKKDFGKIMEEPDWKDKLKKYQKYLKECKEKEKLPETDPEMEKLVDLENRLQACRVATMGRLSELGLVKWIIDKNASSIYSIEK